MVRPGCENFIVCSFEYKVLPVEDVAYILCQLRHLQCPFQGAGENFRLASTTFRPR